MILYFLEKRLLARQEKGLHAGARIHLNVLVLLVFLIEIWDFCSSATACFSRIATFRFSTDPAT